MNNLEFVTKLNQLSATETVYALGCFGQRLTKNLISQKAKQLPKWYTQKRQQALAEKTDKQVFAFDCVGMIKGILWGFDYSLTRANGGAKYISNNVPDLSADQMIKQCNASSDFTEYIEIGEVVWLSGHIGVYAGNNIVIECTPKWKNCVQKTQLTDRAWKKHGKLPWISYGKQPVLSQKTMIVNTQVSNLNVRETPGGRMIDSFRKGLKVEVLDASRADWIKVHGRGISGKYVDGYCSAKYLI